MGNNLQGGNDFLSQYSPFNTRQTSGHALAALI